ncbi:MAG: hypothetical protein M1127_02760 [Patescibacteria group bacterium]|nr:hypothetical protein [Patescibacteria group bacterium]
MSQQEITQQETIQQENPAVAPRQKPLKFWHIGLGIAAILLMWLASYLIYR